MPYFMPTEEIEQQPILGHSKCFICKSYFPDDQEKRNQHLAQHPDRVFMITLPVDTYCFNIEEAIAQFAKLGINRTELAQKVKDCNLIKFPTNLKGYSCNICKVLDTNKKKEFMIHVKEECNVVAKEERLKHLVCFCRGCHVKFPNEFDLEIHSKQGGCWPSMMTVNRIYDRNTTTSTPSQKEKATLNKERMIKIKQEKVERFNQIQIKRERFEEAQFQQQDTSNFFNSYEMENGTPDSNFSVPSTPVLQNILQSVQSNNSGFSPHPPPPSAMHAPRIKTEAQAYQPFQHDVEPSPVYSPIRDSSISSSTNASHPFSHSRYSKSPSLPSPSNRTPFPMRMDPSSSISARRSPSVASSFSTRRSPSADSIISFVSEPRNPKQVSTVNCQRSSCLWIDPHTPECPKLSIMNKCSSSTCEWGDSHRNYPLCKNLSFYCNCKKVANGVYKYYDHIKQVKTIPNQVSGPRDDSVQEKKNVVMRLLYISKSTELKDPRLSLSGYPSSQKIPARSFRGKKGSKKGWTEDNVICTWSGASMVVVTAAGNPHIVSDHDDSDIELWEEGITRPSECRDSSQEREVW